MTTVHTDLGRVNDETVDQHFYQLNRLNWLMVWLLLCCSIILLFPRFDEGAVSQWAATHAAWLGVGMLIAISYFCSQGFLIAWEWACDEWQSRRQQDQLAQMISFLDFNEKAVLREFVLQRKSVINLPITEPAVKNLMDAGVLTYAYGKPVREKEDENQIRALMIALPALPLLTYKVLGLSRGKMSDEQVEQIMNARPKFAQKLPALIFVPPIKRAGPLAGSVVSAPLLGSGLEITGVVRDLHAERLAHVGAVHDEIGGRLVGGDRDVPDCREAQQGLHVRIVGHRIEDPRRRSARRSCPRRSGRRAAGRPHGAGEETGDGQLCLLAEHGAGGAGGIEVVELELLLAPHHPVQQRGLHVVVSHQRHSLVGRHLTGDLFHGHHP